MKNVTMILLVLAVTLSMAACGTGETKTDDDSGSSQANANMPNPFIDCETLLDAEECAGFSISSPESFPDWVSDVKFRAVEGEMVELLYTDGGQQKLVVRKAEGNEDISGVYGTFNDYEDITVDDLTVTLKGNDGKVNVAIWMCDDYSFSIFSVEGLERETVESMISEVH